MKKIVSLLLCFIAFVVSTTFVACNEEGSSKNVYLKYADAQSVMTLLSNGDIDYGLLPEPVATKLEKVKASNIKWKRIDVQELYNSQTCAYPQAVLMVKNEILTTYPQLVAEVKAQFQNVVTWLKTDHNISVAVNAVANKFNSTSLKPATILSATTIDNCKINWQDAADAKESVNAYIDDILGIDVGLGIQPAQTVGDNFFYNEWSNTGNAIENKTFSFIVPDGAPALAISKFIVEEENFVDGATFNYNVVNAESISNYMNGQQGTADFIIMPLNSATLNYANQYKMVSVITHGNLYLMYKNDSIDGLLNKTIGVIGEGKVPDLTLKAILKKRGVSYSTIV